MKNRAMYIISILLVFIFIVIFLLFYSKKELDNPSNNLNNNPNKSEKEKESVSILGNGPYTYRFVYKYVDGNICISNCDSLKEKELYAIIKSESAFPKILPGSDETLAILLEDGNSLKIINLQDKTTRNFDLNKSSNYQLIIFNKKIVGIISNSLESFFYNYDLDKNFYKGQYDKVNYINGFLVASQNNDFYVLDPKRENYIFKIEDNDFEIDKIKYINRIDNKIHIASLMSNGKLIYFIYDIKTSELSRICGDYDDAELYEDTLFAVNNTGAYLYDFSGNLIKTTYFDDNKINKLILNYAITSNENTLSLVNMYNGEKITLFQGISNLTLSLVEYSEETKEIILMLSEYNNNMPKKYKIVYDINSGKLNVDRVN